MAKKPDQKKLPILMNRIEAAENYRDRNYREKWTSWYKLWRNHTEQLKGKDGKPVTDRSNISVPYAFTMVETVLPRLVMTLFAGRPYVTVKGVPFSLAEYRSVPEGGVKPWEANAKKMQQLLDYQQNTVFNLKSKFHTGLKILCLYGTTVAYTGWRLSERNIIRKELLPVADEDDKPLTNDDGTPVMDWQPVQISKKEYDDPDVAFLDLGHFYVDSNASDIDDARYAGHIEYLTKPQLQILEEQGLIQVDWKKVASTTKAGAIDESRNYRMSAVGIPGDPEVDESKNMELYEVHHYWEDDRWAVIINRSYLARDSENPYYHKKKPYDKAVYTEVPKEFYGMGLMEVSEDLQIELNTERNQRIDYRSYSMRRMFSVNRDADINPNELVYRQGGVVHRDKPEDVILLDTKDNNVAASFGEEDRTKQDMKDSTGAQDVVIGTSGGDRSATETMTKDNNASIRFKLIVSEIETDLLVAISRKMMQLNQQFIEDIRLLPLFEDKEWPEITPEDIQGEFHLIAAGSSTEPLANKEAFKQRMVELYGMVVNDPFMQQYPDKRRNLLKKVFEAFDIHDTSELLPTDEELSGMMQEQMFAQLMASLPPEISQLIMQYVNQGDSQPAPSPQQPGSASTSNEGRSNTASMRERGLVAR